MLWQHADPMKRMMKIVLGIAGSLVLGIVLLGLLQHDRIGMPAGAAGSYLDLDGMKIRYVQKGQGRDVLLIHGTPSSLEEWQPVFERWATHFRVTAFDRAGQGYSSRPAFVSGVDFHAQVAKRLMAELHLHDTIVVGHSYGGAVALKLAADDDSPATAFLVVASTIYPSAEWNATLGKLLRLPVAGRGIAVLLGALGGGMVQYGVERAFHPDERLIPAGYIESRKAIWLQPKVTLTVAQEMDVHAQQLSALATRYPGIKRPVYLVAGRGDKPEVVRGAERLARELPGAHVTFLEGAGHMLQFTRPDELTALLDKVDRETTPSTASGQAAVPAR